MFFILFSLLILACCRNLDEALSQLFYLDEDIYVSQGHEFAELFSEFDTQKV